MFNNIWLNGRYHAELAYLLSSWNLCMNIETHQVAISPNVTVDLKLSETVGKYGRNSDFFFLFLDHLLALLLTPVHSRTGPQSSFDPRPLKIYNYNCVFVQDFRQTTSFCIWNGETWHIWSCGVWAITVITKVTCGCYKHGEIRLQGEFNQVSQIKNVHNEWIMWYNLHCYTC